MDQVSKPNALAAKVVAGVAFVVVWIGLGFVLQSTYARFHDGGWGMWPILAAGLTFLWIAIERARYLFGKIKVHQREFSANVQKHLMQGDVRSALDECRQDDSPLARVVGAGLANLDRPDDEVQEAVDEAALYELPKIEARTGYLAMIGNIATLLGLLGTIIGLIKSFAGVSLEHQQDPRTQARAMAYVSFVPVCHALSGEQLVNCIQQNKATVLARGISEAMNCTAFGLLVGILSLLAFSVFNGRTQRLLDDINEVTVHLLNFAVSHRGSMRLHEPTAPPGASYATG